MLSGTKGASPWAETAVQGAGNLLEQALGSYSPALPFKSEVPPQLSEGDEVFRIPCPVLRHQVLVFYAHLPSLDWDQRVWRHLDDAQPDDAVVQSGQGVLLCSGTPTICSKG